MLIVAAAKNFPNMAKTILTEFSEKFNKQTLIIRDCTIQQTGINIQVTGGFPLYVNCATLVIAIASYRFYIPGDCTHGQLYS